MFDCIIIGGGPCGVSSAIYLKRAGYNVAVIEKSFIGGQVAYSSELENYAGFIDKDAFIFCQNLTKQLQSLQIPIFYEEVISLDKKDKKIIVKTNKAEHISLTCILSIGAESRKLGLEKEKAYIGRGVCYCAVCDGNFYRNKDVVIVGGGNSALEDAIYLSNICNKVYIVHRRDVFTGEKMLVNRVNELTIENNGNIEILFNSTLQDICGNDKVEKVIVNQNGSNIELAVSGVFIAIGRVPKTEFLQGFLDLDKNYILVNNKFETSKEGIYAGGDCIPKQMRQVVTAVSDGAIISKNISDFLQ